MWIIALIGFALSLTDAFLTNQIGFELNPLLIPLLGSCLYFAKLVTLPLWLFLAYCARKNNRTATVILYLGVFVYAILVISEAMVLLLS